MKSYACIFKGVVQFFTFFTACAMCIHPQALAASFGPSDAARVEKPIIYYNPSRTAHFYFDKNIAGFSLVPSKRPGKEEQDQNAEETNGIIYSCSNDAYRCLKSRWSVYAVPRTFALDIQNYVVGGVSFTVLECQKRTETRCQVALIEADCQWAVSEFGECSLVPGGRVVSPRGGWVKAFIYNEDFGITALGSVASHSSSDDRLTAARRAAVYSLQGSDGLLKQSKVRK